ncbi:Cloroperoxidase [Bimuria novae-zelandiae CBS 107.79]|uniref:Cloroperoxidase n=1 Tax=Bimuria novae-zelandiae CBS 107.79 TaxID=1447943 RepID=A0A6A5V907_9PLEO|nr:Cloroperoxidase [Bimuria novae-zelandiae CBS 107.79]
MLNTLANHGYLPHSGRGITLERTIHALDTALNINQDIARNLFGFALTTNPEGNTTGVFSLENLGTHNVLEHDASLSRADYATTLDSVSFNETVFAETQAYFTTTDITVQQAADARLARYLASQRTNPDYNMSSLGDIFSAGESAAYLFIMGNIETATAPRRFVEYLFREYFSPLGVRGERVAMDCHICDVVLVV